MEDIEYKLSATDKYSWQRVAFDPKLFGNKADCSGLLSIETISGDAADQLLRDLGKDETRQNSEFESKSKKSRNDGSRPTKVATSKQKAVVDAPSLEHGFTVTVLKKRLHKEMLRERSSKRRRSRKAAAAAAAAPITSGEDDAVVPESNAAAADPAATADDCSRSALAVAAAAGPDSGRKKKRRKRSASADAAKDGTEDDPPSAGAGVKAQARAVAKARAGAGAAAHAGAAEQAATAAAAAEYDDAWEYCKGGGIMLLRSALPRACLTLPTQRRSRATLLRAAG
jgi:hypothetical protein